jgi:hypothetical protein
VSTIRASELGTFLYCKRAWWYHQKGQIPANQQELAAGTKIHMQNSRQAIFSGCLRAIAYGLFITAIVLLAIYLTSKLI